MGVNQSKLDTELLILAANGDLKGVQNLLRKGANLYATNRSSENVLHLACMSPTCGKNRKQLILHLLEVSQGKLLSANVYGHLPTYMAAVSRDMTFLETFLQSGYVHLTDRFSENLGELGQCTTLLDKAAVIHKESDRFQELIAKYTAT